jgi:NAD(P)-dependent dehydrogenase (short-subunit alcohol dehydrogenase family)
MTETTPLAGKIAWVTGAGSGIGRAGAIALAAAGAHVVLSGRRVAELDGAAAEIGAAGGSAETAPLDVTDKTAVTKAAAAIESRHGKLDILVNSAGFNVPNRHWPELTPENFDKIYAVNIQGAFYCTHAVLPGMRARRDGLIINIASISGRWEFYTTGPAYNSSKAAMLALTASLNNEEGPNGVRACAICAGAVATPMVRRREVPPPDGEIDRMLQLEDMARAIRFIAETPARVCFNELVITPTWNRFFIGEPPNRQRKFPHDPYLTQERK